MRIDELLLAKPLPPRKRAGIMTDALHTAAQTSKAWPFEEARKIVKRYPGGKRDAAGELVVTTYNTIVERGV
jgi:hypothetical protein